jgi:hypothetical protein
MSDPRPDPAFAEALLAQEPALAADRYAAHRRALDRKLADEARRLRVRPAWLSRPTRRAALALALGAAAAVAAFFFLRPGPPAGREAEVFPGAEEVVLRPAGQLAAACMAPWGVEDHAGFIAVAAVGDGTQRAGERYVRLHVERRLKGDLPGKRVDVPDRAVDFCCPLPDAPAPSPLHRKGARVLLFLVGSERDGWEVAQVEALQAERVAAVERFLAVCAAGKDADAAKAYGRCLAPAAGGLDEPARGALSLHPDPRAGDALLALLERASRRLLAEAAARPEPLPPATCEPVLSLVDVLRRINESRAAPPAIACAPHLPEERRRDVYEALPELLKKADETTLKAVRQALIAQTRTEDAERAMRALGKIADAEALDVLLAEQARRPVRQTNAAALAAVREAAARLGGKAATRARDAWAALLADYRAEAAPSPVEQEFVRGVGAALRAARLTEAQRRRLETARDRAAGWLRGEIDRVLAP